jgi:hypothetical protein
MTQEMTVGGDVVAAGSAEGWRANRDQQGAALTVSQLVIGSQGA